MVNGLIVLNKQKDISSAFAVRKFAKEMGVKKAGHAGTLDPMATGVLIVGVGTGTRILRFMESLDKVYVGEISLGVSTDTDDAYGNIVRTEEFINVSEELIQITLKSFLGAQKQRPPSFSAVKVDGKRAYAEARQGNMMVLSEREIVVHKIELLNYDCASGKISVRIFCSKGTYIRSIARDFGLKLGCGAHLSALTRESIGRFDLSNSLMYPGQISVEEFANALIPLDRALYFLSQIQVNENDALALKQGKSLPNLKNYYESYKGTECVYVVDSSRNPVCLATLAKDESSGMTILSPSRMLT